MRGRFASSPFAVDARDGSRAFISKAFDSYASVRKAREVELLQARKEIAGRLVGDALDLGGAALVEIPTDDEGNPRVSPDGRRLLIETVGSNIEAYDFARGTRSRLTSTALGTGFSTWTSDGEAVVFRRDPMTQCGL